ncbi:thermonuclease family protein [Loktanella sp. M215]|uniref:thermonuclease family protein n=1 Tax=Loktanella sp. M215 TaxID=2675431 RepID=UPI001F1D841E|nr:thermonuclease family protein [Loktanella sp. M215]
MAARADLSGPARVIDGDTLQIGETRIRLHGIDAPEAAQTCRSAAGVTLACGAAATTALRSLIAGQPVTCAPRDTDRYGRTVARCTARGQDSGRGMVAAGMARAYQRYSTDYVADEAAAQAGGRGLWAAQMQNPADYRAARKAAPAATGSCQIKGNISGGGHIYHMPGQENYAATRISTARGERWFCTEAEARAAGWRAARR